MFFKSQRMPSGHVQGLDAQSTSEGELKNPYSDGLVTFQSRRDRPEDWANSNMNRNPSLS